MCRRSPCTRPASQGAVSDAMDVLDRHLSEPEIRDITYFLLQGLSYLHSKRLIHRRAPPRQPAA